MATPDWIALYLEEDLGTAGDITSDSIFEPTVVGTARLVARERCFVAGVAHAVDVFGRLGCTATANMNDGSWVDAGDTILTIQGPTRGILAAERLALNIIGRMSGIATQTRTLMERLATACSAARVAGTRKTTPGFRAFEKAAIIIGGGDPHRFGLHDAAMIKDNHREAAGDIASAVAAVHATHPGVTLTAEVESLDDALAAAQAGAQWLLIDNQSPETGRQWAEQVWEDHPGVKIEASGGITADIVTDYGWADRISLGALTTAARSQDFSLEWGA